MSRRRSTNLIIGLLGVSVLVIAAASFLLRRGSGGGVYPEDSTRRMDGIGSPSPSGSPDLPAGFRDSPAGLSDDPKDGFLGVIVARQSVELTSQFEGRLQAVLVQLGDPVRQGTIVAQLDTALVHQQLSSALSEQVAASAGVEKADAARRLAETAYERAKMMEAGETISRQKLEEAAEEKISCDAESKRLRAVEEGAAAQVRRLREELRLSQIRAPFAGTVAQRYRNPGAMVDLDIPVLRLVSDDLVVRFALPVELAGRVRADTPIEVEIPESGIRVHGLVQRVGSEAEPGLGLVIVEGVLKDGDLRPTRIRSGVSVRVWLVSTR